MFRQLVVIFTISSSVSCWENVPQIPSNRRSQFYLRHDDGAYKYGYDSGDGIAANQVSSADNQVEGFYSFPDESGNLVKVKYTAGVQGFVPETSEQHSEAAQSRVQVKSNSNAWSQGQQWSHQFETPSMIALPPRASEQRYPQNQHDHSNSDASYQISFNTGEHAREEKSDSSGNVQGRYSYVDEAGEHDLSYIAGPEIGYKVVGGSLANANGLGGKSLSSNANQRSWSQPSSQKAYSGDSAVQSWQSSHSKSAQPSTDGSYSFSYNTGDHSRAESSDANGNVQGRYAYSDEAGNHDLSYVAGADSGFVVKGGSLSQPNGLAGKASEAKAQHKSWSQTPIHVISAAPRQDYIKQLSNQDGSAYEFSYEADGQSRQESSDTTGRVRGGYTVQTDGGHQQLQFDIGGSGASSRNFKQSEALSSHNSNQDQASQEFHATWKDFGGPVRSYNTDASVHPTFTVITPSENQKSYENGPNNAIIVGYLPPRHAKKHGYIYDTPN